MSKQVQLTYLLEGVSDYFERNTLWFLSFLGDKLLDHLFQHVLKENHLIKSPHGRSPKSKIYFSKRTSGSGHRLMTLISRQGEHELSFTRSVKFHCNHGRPRSTFTA